jgi:hypothetical protein
VRTESQRIVVVCAVRLHSPHANKRIQLQAYTSQSSTVVTHCILIATNLPTTEGWTVWLTVSAPGFDLRARQRRGQ